MTDRAKEDVTYECERKHQTKVKKGSIVPERCPTCRQPFTADAAAADVKKQLGDALKGLRDINIKL